VLPVRSESRDECSGSISDSIGCNQVRILHLGLASVTEENSDQAKRVQFALIVGVIGCKLYIL